MAIVEQGLGIAITRQHGDGRPGGEQREQSCHGLQRIVRPHGDDASRSSPQGSDDVPGRIDLAQQFGVVERLSITHQALAIAMAAQPADERFETLVGAVS